METYDGPAWRLISTLREVASKGPLDVLDEVWLELFVALKKTSMSVYYCLR